VSRTTIALLALAGIAASAAPRPARAHGVSAEVDQRAGAVAVRARYEGGRPLADAQYVVQSPRGGDAPFAEGRTDRHGWLAFTPDVAGRWTVRIADASGHGKTVEVDVAKAALPAAPAAPGTAGAPLAIELAPQGGTRDAGAGATAPAGSSGGTSAWRGLAGITAILVVFRVLLTVQRARRAKGK
jgi:nickel transport protein